MSNSDVRTVKGHEAETIFREVEHIVEGSRDHLVGVLKNRRDQDVSTLDTLTQQQAYDLGMCGTLAALDSVGAWVEYSTPEGLEVSLFGGLESLFNDVNS